MIEYKVNYVNDKFAWHAAYTDDASHSMIRTGVEETKEDAINQAQQACLWLQQNKNEVPADYQLPIAVIWEN